MKYYKFLLKDQARLSSVLEKITNLMRDDYNLSVSINDLKLKVSSYSSLLEDEDLKLIAIQELRSILAAENLYSEDNMKE